MSPRDTGPIEAAEYSPPESAGPAGSTGSARAQATVSAASYGYLLDLFRSRTGWTRQQLLETTGVSRTTLYDRLDVLFQEGLVYSAGSVPHGDAASPARGRRSELLRFDDRNKVVLVLDAGQIHMHVCIADLHGRMLRMRTLRRAIDTDPRRYLDEVFDTARALLGTETGEQLVGVALGIPGPVDSATGVLGRSTTMPQWQSFPIVEAIRAQWPVPVVIENDAHAFALGEASEAGRVESVIAVKYSTGIGAGIVVDGKVLRGSDGAAGDIGHVRITEDGPLCTCGRHGCLAAYASGHALVRDLAHTGVQTVEDVAARVAAGDGEVTAAVARAVDHLSQVLGAIVTAINPDVVVLGGSLGRLPFVVDRIDRQVHVHVVDRAIQRLQITSARLGDHGATTGLARHLVDAVYAPQNIDAALAARAAQPAVVAPSTQPLARTS